MKPNQAMDSELEQRAALRRIRNLVIGLALALLPVLLAPVLARAASVDKAGQATLDALSKHFASVPTMSGEFVQFGPNGEQTGGTFYIARPGKVRFDYEKPATVEVVSNGSVVAVHNRKLDTWDFYPLKATPLKLLLDDRIDLNGKNVRSVSADAENTTVVMGDRKVFGDSQITLIFDPKNFDLRQWTVKDAKGKETSVMIFNVQKGVKIPAKLFEFDERALQQRQQQRMQSNR